MSIRWNLQEGEVRRCGACTACCTVVAVSEIEKPERTRCPNVRRSGAPGCGIYEDRPAGCAAYSCGWLRGFGTRGDRPDELGLILDEGSNAGGIPVVVAREVREGSSLLPRAARHIRELREKVVVVVADWQGNRRAAGPNDLMQKLLKRAENGDRMPQ